MSRRMRTLSWGLVLSSAFILAACETEKTVVIADSAAKPETQTAPSAVPSATATEAAAASAAPSAAASADPAAEAAASAEEDKASEGVRSYHRHHHGGVAMFIHMAIDTLGVPDDKKADIEKIQKDLKKAMKPVHEAERDVLAALSEGIAAGKVDDAKVKAAVAKEEKAAEAVHPATVEALEKLHAALTPEQRAALVDKVNAHVEIWKKTSEEEYGNKEKNGRLAELKDELSLTDEQVDKISAALKKDAPPKPDAAKFDAHVKEFTTAFAAEKFDAKTLKADKEAEMHVAKHGAARLVRFYSIVAPLLTPEQRTKLAESLKARSEEHDKGKLDKEEGEKDGTKNAKHEKKEK